MKYEWKKHEKALYGAKSLPALVQIPAQSFIRIKGCGNPNDTDFSNRVAALFSLAYKIKMEYKAAAREEPGPDAVHDFAVYPLEGVWKQKDDIAAAGELIKENLEYTVMIRQPDFITAEMVQAALEKIKAKKPEPLYEEIVFDTMYDGKCVEMLHIGPYDSEPASFAEMARFMAENGLQRIAAEYHREIYLNSPNRVRADKLKTILRYRVK